MEDKELEIAIWNIATLGVEYENDVITGEELETKALNELARVKKLNLHSIKSSEITEIGDKVRVIANTSDHEFKLGEVVTVLDTFLNEKRPNIECSSGGESWWLYEEEWEKVI